MLNIFADALLIAARMGRLPEDEPFRNSTQGRAGWFRDGEKFSAQDIARARD